LRPDQPFEIHTYPGVYHAFDGASATQTVYMGHILQHNQAAAEDSFIRVHAFLERWVRP
jgi:dienelactone hydrolase